MKKLLLLTLAMLSISLSLSACYMRDGSADQRELAATSPTSPYYTPQTRRWRVHDRLSEKVHVPHPAMPDGIIGGG